MERQNVIRRGSHVGLPTIHQTDTQTFLSLRQVRNLLSAAFYAEAVGMQLFLFLTIAWRETPHFQNRDDQWNELQRRVFADLHSFCHARQIPLAYIWVRERKPGIGAHTHVLLYLGRGQIRPRTAVVRLKAILRRRYSFGPRGLHFGWKPDASDRFDRLAYLLKATDPAPFVTSD